MGIFDGINRALFNLTYNEQASKAYDEQNEKAATAVEDLKKQIDGYRQRREKIIGAGESTDYFSSNSIARITEWENWLQKNGGLAEGDYTKKSTDMKTQWESLININEPVKEMGRIGEFITLYIKDKELKIPSAQKQELEDLKAQAEKYFKNIVKQTPADILKKREEFNQKFTQIQKKIPENFEDLKEPFEDAIPTPASLLGGITEDAFNRYKAQVLQRDQAEAGSFSVTRLFQRAFLYFMQAFAIIYPFFFGIVFGMIAANDAIGRPAPYRVFYFIFMIILFYGSVIPGFKFIVVFYYLYRAISALNWGNLFSMNPQGPRMDYMQAPVLFTFLPIYEAKEGDAIPWFMWPWQYSASAYDGLAKKKMMAYEMNAAKLVGKTLDPSIFGMDSKTFNQVICELKSVLLQSDKDKKDDAMSPLPPPPPPPAFKGRIVNPGEPNW